jgi:site-specific DNA-methyltransferase (adenine-specific)
MSESDHFFKALGIKSNDRKAVAKLSRTTGISAKALKYHNNTNTLPTGEDLDRVCSAAGISPLFLTLAMGKIDRQVLAAIQENAGAVGDIIRNSLKTDPKKPSKPPISLETEYGRLYHGDCLALLPHIDDDSIDLIFADPPFNLNKLYPSKMNDDLKADQYLRWCESWAAECARILKPGGGLFIWNLPKWNIPLAAYLDDRLTFRHWVAVDLKFSLPIPGRLYPSHYSMIYFCKGEKPKTFHPDRLPMEICPHCMGDLRDYGGYKNKMNPRGVNMTDVWFDIPPVRHAKYKKRKTANELSIRLMDRVIEMASDENDLVFDPFGGAGTTYVVSEIKKRRWIGVELGPVDDIVNRFRDIEEESRHLAAIRSDYNQLFTDRTLQKRRLNGLWTPESVRSNALN